MDDMAVHHDLDALSKEEADKYFEEMSEQEEMEYFMQEEAEKDERERMWAEEAHKQMHGGEK